MVGGQYLDGLGPAFAPWNVRSKNTSAFRSKNPPEKSHLWPCQAMSSTIRISTWTKISEKNVGFRPLKTLVKNKEKLAEHVFLGEGSGWLKLMNPNLECWYLQCLYGGKNSSISDLRMMKSDPWAFHERFYIWWSNLWASTELSKWILTWATWEYLWCKIITIVNSLEEWHVDMTTWCWVIQLAKKCRRTIDPPPALNFDG